MKLLLTGATGFVGRNFLIHALRNSRYNEIFLPLRSPEKLRAQLLGDGWEKVPEQIRTLNWSARDPLLTPLPQFDHVVHCAGTLFGNSQSEFYDTNVAATIKLLESIKDSKRIVILSSQAAAGPCLKSLFRHEWEAESPLSWYGQSKLEMEKKILLEFSHLPLVILRPSMILGARDLATLPLFKMARFPIRFKPGRRSKAYSFISVADLVQAVETVLTSEREPCQLNSRVFFVSHERVISDRELIEAAGLTFKMPGFTISVPQPLLKTVSRIITKVPRLSRSVPSLAGDRAKDIWSDRWVVSPKLFTQTFNWKARIDLPVALKEAKDWYVRSGQL